MTLTTQDYLSSLWRLEDAYGRPIISRQAFPIMFRIRRSFERSEDTLNVMSVDGKAPPTRALKPITPHLLLSEGPTKIKEPFTTYSADISQGYMIDDYPPTYWVDLARFLFVKIPEMLGGQAHGQISHSLLDKVAGMGKQILQGEQYGTLLGVKFPLLPIGRYTGTPRQLMLGSIKKRGERSKRNEDYGDDPDVSHPHQRGTISRKRKHIKPSHPPRRYMVDPKIAARNKRRKQERRLKREERERRQEIEQKEDYPVEVIAQEGGDEDDWLIDISGTRYGDEEQKRGRIPKLESPMSIDPSGVPEVVQIPIAEIGTPRPFTYRSPSAIPSSVQVNQDRAHHQPDQVINDEKSSALEVEHAKGYSTQFSEALGRYAKSVNSEVRRLFGINDHMEEDDQFYDIPALEGPPALEDPPRRPQKKIEQKEMIEHKEVVNDVKADVDRFLNRGGPVSADEKMRLLERLNRELSEKNTAQRFPELPPQPSPPPPPVVGGADAENRLRQSFSEDEIREAQKHSATFLKIHQHMAALKTAIENDPNFRTAPYQKAYRMVSEIHERFESFIALNSPENLLYTRRVRGAMTNLNTIALEANAIYEDAQRMLKLINAADDHAVLSNTVRDELSSLMYTIKNERSDLDKAKRMLQRYEDQELMLARSVQEREQHREHVAKLRNEVEEREADIRRMEGEIETMRAQHHDTAQQHSTTHAKKDRMVMRLQKKIRHLDEMIMVMGNEMKKSEDIFRAQLHTLEEQNRNLNDQLRIEEAKLASLQEATMVQSLESKAAETELYNAIRADFEVEWRTKLENAERATNQIINAQTLYINELEEKGEAYGAELAVALNERDMLQQEVEVLRQNPTAQDVANIVTRVRAAEYENDLLNETVEDLRDSLERHDAELKNARLENELARANMASLEEAIKQQVLVVSELRERLTQGGNENRALRQMLVQVGQYLSRVANVKMYINDSGELTMHLPQMPNLIVGNRRIEDYMDLGADLEPLLAAITEIMRSSEYVFATAHEIYRDHFGALPAEEKKDAPAPIPPLESPYGPIPPLESPYDPIPPLETPVPPLEVAPVSHRRHRSQPIIIIDDNDPYIAAHTSKRANAIRGSKKKSRFKKE